MNHLNRQFSSIQEESLKNDGESSMRDSQNLGANLSAKFKDKVLVFNPVTKKCKWVDIN